MLELAMALVTTIGMRFLQVCNTIGVTKSPTATPSGSQGAVAQLDDTGRGMSGNIRHPESNSIIIALEQKLWNSGLKIE